jgi:ribonuclease T
MGTEGSRTERFISVDIEASGPIPGEYSMLALGACEVANLASTFYVELKPINQNFVAAAIAVSSLKLDVLTTDGHDPARAMSQFQDWLRGIIAPEETPIFVGFNGGFDWSFVNWYFHKYLGENPFGFSSLDIKSFYMGFMGCRWSETKSSKLPARYQPSQPLTHNALDDAVAQAETFQKILVARPLTHATSAPPID